MKKVWGKWKGANKPGGADIKAKYETSSQAPSYAIPKL